MAQQFELVKLVVQSVVAVREGDRVVDEILSSPVACYSPERVGELWQEALAQVAEQNAANGNRASRRKAANRE